MVLDILNTSSDDPISLFTESLLNEAPKIPSIHRYIGYYKIETIQKSETAGLIFARHTVTQESVVIKVLIEYQDTRYSLATISDRQHSQLEALRWNKVFTPDVYIGLAHICELDWARNRIAIDEIIEKPDGEVLVPNIEYVLLMRQLPNSRRLDYILREESDVSLRRYVHLLTKDLIHIHTNVEELSIPIEDAKQWGSSEQLWKKLTHNLEFLDQILATGEIGQYKSYHWLKKSLLEIFKLFKDKEYFEYRILDQRIKRCHADLKAQNIWIAPLPGAPYEKWSDREPWKYIYLLDAVDFNPMYSNIDILSDFAMLVVDIHARTKSSALADSMIEYYLQYTNQQDKVSKRVLAYYLVEKAIVSAAVSILYDKMPDLGLAFLDVAVMRMTQLECLVGVATIFMREMEWRVEVATTRIAEMESQLAIVSARLKEMECEMDRQYRLLVGDSESTTGTISTSDVNHSVKESLNTKRKFYTPEFKAKLVLEVLKGQKSATQICFEHGIAPNLLSYWRRMFIKRASQLFITTRQKSTEQAVTAKRKFYTPEFKAKLVLEVLKGQKSATQICFEHGIVPNLLSYWRRMFIKRASQLFITTRQKSVQ